MSKIWNILAWLQYINFIYSTTYIHLKKKQFTLFVNKISKCFQHDCDKIRLGNKNIKPSKKVLTSCKTEIIAIFVFPAPVGAHTCKVHNILMLEKVTRIVARADTKFTYDSPIYSHWCCKLSEIFETEYGSKFCTHEKQLERSHPTPLSQSGNMQEFKVRMHAISQKRLQ